MPDDKIEWLSDQECREAEVELSEKQTRDQFFAYQSNSQEEYERLMRDNERTGVLLDKIIAFEIIMAEHDPPRHFIFEVDMEYPATLHDRDDDYSMAPELMAITPETTGPKKHET